MKLCTWILLCALMAPAWAAEVKNGAKPAGKPKTLLFTEELRIGPEGDDFYDVWKGAWVAVAVNKAGHMFVADQVENRIVHYDAAGDLVGQHGKRGMAPGEYIDLRNLSLLADQSLVVFESRGGNDTLSKLDSAGNYKDRKTLERTPRAMQSMLIAPNGKTRAGFYFSTPVDGMNQIGVGVFDESGKEKLVISQGKVMMFNSAMTNDPKWWVQYAIPWFSFTTKDQGYFAFGADSSVYFAKVNDYKVTHYSPDLSKSVVFTKPIEPSFRSEEDAQLLVEQFKDELSSIMPPFVLESLTPRVIKEALEKADVPKRKNVIYGLVPLENGGLIVVSKHNWKTRESHGDLFDKNGKLIGSAKLPPIVVNLSCYFSIAAKLWFIGGKAYAIETNSEDELYLVRYSYKWVDQKS